jgi:hypothetical protein
VDISVQIQDAVTATPISDAMVDISVAPSGRPREAVCIRATSEAATNKLFQAASFELPAPGVWQIEVTIDGPHGPARFRVELEAAEPQPRWEEMAFWIAWPAFPILLFSIHQVLTHRGWHRLSEKRRPADC